MKIHGFQLQEGSAIKNMTVDSGPAFPIEADLGELFFLTDNQSGDQGLFVYTGVSWKSLDPSSLAMQDHATTHLPDGRDAIPTATAVGLSPTSVNSTGVSNALARADHTHELTGLQSSTPELTSLISQTGHGLAVRTADGEWSIRELSAPTSGISIDNADGVLGNPSFNLTDDLAALEGLTGTGLAVRTGDSIWTQRSIAGTAGDVTISNGDGVLGNPTISLNDTGIAIDTYVALTVDSKGRAISGAKTQPWSTISNTPTSVSGYGITDAQPLDADLTAIAAVAGTGFLARTAANSWSQRSIGSTSLNIINGDGVTGNPSINLPTVGTPSTYAYVTTDEYGRVVNGVPTSGLVAQQITGDIPVATTTSTIPFDNSIPNSNEGALLSSVTITPNSVNSRITGVAAMTVDVGNNARSVIVTVFRANVIVALATVNVTSSGRPENLSVSFTDLPQSTSPVVYNMRIGQNTSGTTYINRAAGASFGGAGASAFIVTEIL